MRDLLEDLPSVQTGHLTVEDSLGPNPRSNLADVRYVLVNNHDPHANDSLGTQALPEEVRERLAKSSPPETLQAYLNSERDAGIHPLLQDILQKCNGGIGLTVNTNRGVLNLNRNAGPKAVPNIWTPEDRGVVAPALLRIHRRVSRDIWRVLRAVGQKVPLLFLHSMDPNGFKKGTRPGLSPETFDAYVAAQGLPASEKNPRENDFITGRAKGKNRAHQGFYAALKDQLTAAGKTWCENAPYDTEPGYPDWSALVEFPGRVGVVDLLKTELCKGDSSTFDSRNPTPDPERIAFMANLYKTALETTLAS